MTNRLYRSRANQMIAGVCGGLAEYLKIDATLIRIFFIVLALGSGVGVALYLIMWIIMPYGGEEQAPEAGAPTSGANEVSERLRSMGDDVRQALHQPNPKAALTIGVALIILGVVFLGESLNLPWLRWLRFDALWPLLLIALGALMMWRRYRND